MNKLKFYRKQNKLSQKYVANYLKISQPSYANLENNKTTIKFETAIKLSKLFNIDLKELTKSEIKSVSISIEDFKTLQKIKNIIIKLEDKYNL